jgi:hypothetical protein
MNSTRQNGVLIALALAVLLAFLVHPVLFGTTIFQLNSIGASPVLFLKIAYERFQQLDFVPPMWTALYGSGAPLATGIATFNPGVMLVSFISPFANALVAYDVLLRAIGLAGTYILCRQNGVERTAALTAAGIFVFNPLASSAAQDPQIGLSVFLLPWTLLAAQRLVTRPTWLAALGLSGTLALFYFVSMTQIYLYTLFILIAPFVVALWSAIAIESTDWPGAFERSVRFAWCLLIAIAAHVALTAFDVVQQVQNLTGSLASLDAPGIKGDFGVVAPLVVLLSVLLVAGLRARQQWLRALAAVGIVAGYGSVFAFVSLNVSTIVRANFGSVGLDEFVFGLQRVRYLYPAISTALCAFGLWCIVRRGEARTGLLVLAAVGAAYGLVGWLGAHSPYHFPRFLFVACMGFCALVALSINVLIERLRHRLPAGRLELVATLIAMLTIAEAANLYLRQSLFNDAVKYTRVTTPEMRYLAGLPADARVIDEYEDEHKFWVRNPPLSRQAVPRWVIPPYAGAQTLSRVGIPFVRDEFQNYYDRALRKTYFGTPPGGAWSPLLDVAAVTHLISRKDPAAPRQAELRGPDYVISRNPSALPRVQVYDGAIVLDDQAGLNELEKSARGKTPAIVAPEHRNLLPALASGATGSAQVTAARNEDVAITATVSGRSLIVLADAYHPGWRATVDGWPAPVLRANVTFRGLVVEEGTHRIEFRFLPDYHRVLLILAVAALALHLAGAAIALVRRRRSG